jgi:hypothetical protein
LFDLDEGTPQAGRDHKYRVEPLCRDVDRAQDGRLLSVSSWLVLAICTPEGEPLPKWPSAQNCERLLGVERQRDRMYSAPERGKCVGRDRCPHVRLQFQGQVVLLPKYNPLPVVADFLNRFAESALLPGSPKAGIAFMESFVHESLYVEIHQRLRWDAAVSLQIRNHILT